MYWKRLIATCFGLGWMPVAPGTWGSLPPAIVFGLMMYFCAPPIATAIVMAVMVVVGCVACVCCGPASIAATGRQDPGEVVMDEFAAQALTFLAVPFLTPRNWATKRRLRYLTGT
jgi:phosphatidylglycerophosphatase A